MLNELENKIRKAIPELTSYKVGERISFYNTSDIVTYVNNTFNYLDTISYREIHFDDIDLKPIQLNHVLEYVMEVKVYFKNSKSKSVTYIIDNWNLKSNLLSEQSKELWRFILELKKD